MLICVFDPLAVALVLAFNIATRGSILKEAPEDKKKVNLEKSTIFATETSLPSVTPTPTTSGYFILTKAEKPERASRSWTTSESQLKKHVIDDNVIMPTRNPQS